MIKIPKIKEKDAVPILVIAAVVILVIAYIFGITTTLGAYYSSPSGYHPEGTFKWTSTSTATVDIGAMAGGTMNGETVHPSYAIDGFKIQKTGQEYRNGKETLIFKYTSKNGDSGTAPCEIVDNVQELCYFNNGKTTVIAHLTAITTLDTAYIKSVYQGEQAMCKDPDYMDLVSCTEEDAYNFYLKDHARSWTFQFYIKDSDTVVWDCNPGSVQTKSCWDGSTVDYKKCSADGQWKSGTSCPSGCGDGTCKSSEKGVCEVDCPTTSTTTTTTTTPVCGNSLCETGESSTNCVQDCSAEIVIPEENETTTTPETTTPSSEFDVLVFCIVPIIILFGLAIAVVIYFIVNKR